MPRQLRISFLFAIARQSRAKIRPKLEEHSSAAGDFVSRTLGVTSVAGLFLLRVILGRIPWIVASGAAALMWVAYHQPSDASARDQLRPLARLMNAEGKDWVPNQDCLKHGCVVIVHGMLGNIMTDRETKSWPRSCAQKIEAALGDKAPDICVVDWHEAAETARFTQTALGLTKSGEEDLPVDLAGVRSQAYEVGDLLAFRLITMIMDQKHPTIRRDQPLHLIGHSVGCRNQSRDFTERIQCHPTIRACDNPGYSRTGNRNDENSARHVSG